MAPAPGNRVFLADADRGLLVLDIAGGRERMGALPPGMPLALASYGSRLLLGTESGLFTSPDGGRTWRAATGVTGRRFLAVGQWQDEMAAAAWADRLWVSNDSGQSWRVAETPPGDTEFSALSLSNGGTDLAATHLGLLRSLDRGRKWERVEGPPNRMTAVDHLGGYLYAGDWRGRIYESSGDGSSWRQTSDIHAGIWAISGASLAVASTAGLYLGGVAAPGPAAGKEVNALASSGGVLYVSLARGGVYASDDAGRRWRTVLER